MPKVQFAPLVISFNRPNGDEDLIAQLNSDGSLFVNRERLEKACEILPLTAGRVMLYPSAIPLMHLLRAALNYDPHALPTWEEVDWPEQARRLLGLHVSVNEESARPSDPLPVFEYQKLHDLGSLIRALSVCGPSLPVRFFFQDDTTRVPNGKIHSWRGVYSELALGWHPEDSGTVCTVSDLLKVLRSAVWKAFPGWKGGSFVMTSRTLMHVDEPGEYTDGYISAVTYFDGMVYIHVTGESR